MPMNLLRLVLSVAATGLFLSSCSTTAGFGQDLQKVGQKLEDKAEETGGTE